MTYAPCFDPLLKFKLNGFDSSLALESVKDAVSLYGWYGFMTHFFDTKDANDRDPYYGGFGITHNPDSEYAPEHASALGESKMNLHNFFSTNYGRKLWCVLEERKIAAKFFEVCFLGGLPAVKEFLLKIKSLILQTVMIGINRLCQKKNLLKVHIMTHMHLEN